MLKTISSQYLDVCLGDMPSGGAEAGSRGRASDTASWAWLKVIHCTVMRCSPSSATLAARNKEWLSLTKSNSNGRRQQRCTETPQRLACRGLEQWNDKYHLESRGQVQGLSTDSGTTERESDGRGKGHPKEEAIQDRRNEILGGRRRIPISQLISPTGPPFHSQRIWDRGFGANSPWSCGFEANSHWRADLRQTCSWGGAWRIWHESAIFLVMILL